jgi:hypothetical protein
VRSFLAQATTNWARAGSCLNQAARALAWFGQLGAKLAASICRVFLLTLIPM